MILLVILSTGMMAGGEYTPEQRSQTIQNYVQSGILDNSLLTGLPTTPYFKVEVINNLTSECYASATWYIEGEEPIDLCPDIPPGSACGYTFPCAEYGGQVISIGVCGEGECEGNNVIQFYANFKHYPNGLGYPPTLVCSYDTNGSSCPKTKILSCTIPEE